MGSLVSTDEPRVSSQERLLQKIQESHPGYHPVLAMVDLAVKVDHEGEDGDRSLAFACHREVAKYTVQVDRVSEIKAEVKQTRRVVVELFGGEESGRTAEASPVATALDHKVQDVSVVTGKIIERGPAEESELAPAVEVGRRGRALVEETTENTLTERMW